MLKLECFGAKGDGVTNDREAIALAARSEMAVCGTSGKTYFIDINGPNDSIPILSNTVLNFPENCYLKWDYFGAPLFFIQSTEKNITVNGPKFLYNGTVSSVVPHTKSELEQAFNLPVGYFPSQRPYLSNIAIFGADDVAIKNSSTAAISPGCNRSVPVHISFGGKPDGTKAKNLTIENIYLNDYQFGILGGGYDCLRIIGDLFSGRYDDYSLYGWSAPGHLIYHTQPSNDVVIGRIYDAGKYIGTSPHGSYNCVKLLYMDRVSIEKIVSYRPHGVFDSYGLKNGHSGSIFWRNQEIGAVNTVFAITNDGADASNTSDMFFESAQLFMPTADRIAIQLLGRDYGTLTNCVFGKVFIDMDVAAINIAPIQWRATKCSILDLVLKTRTPTTRGMVSLSNHADGNYINGRAIEEQNLRVADSSIGVNYATILGLS